MNIDAGRVMALRDTILEQNSALRRASARGPYAGDLAPTSPTVAPTGSFSEVMQSAVRDVNGMANEASRMSEAYERGEVTDIAAVMLARQQASIGFEATLQVRNKLLSAYKDMMSMPV